MRTTLQLDDEFVVQAKISAARSGRTLSQVIEDALRQALASHAELTPSAGVGTHQSRASIAGLLDLVDGSR